jgi:hypothetical protein
MRKSLEQLELDAQEEEVTFPEDISETCRDFIKGLLQKSVEDRLGCSADKSIPHHPWFKEQDWARMERKDISPPTKPKLYVDPNGFVVVVELFHIIHHVDNGTHSRTFSISSIMLTTELTHSLPHPLPH